MTGDPHPMDGFDLPALRRMLSSFEDALREARAASERIEREHGLPEDPIREDER
jgi:hypothetical protein